MTKGAGSTEHSFIEQFLSPLAGKGALNLEDDCAHVELANGRTLLLSKDIMVEGRHFPKGAAPRVIAQRALGSALSDIAASGGVATGYMLGVMTPKETAKSFMAALSVSLKAIQDQYGLRVLGGDTVADDKISLSVTVLGETKRGVSRAGALARDALYVSGTIGDSAAALPFVLGQKTIETTKSDAVNWLIDRYERPQPRLGLGPAVSAYASGAIDISDGLACDALRIAAASGHGVSLDASKIPTSSALCNVLPDIEERLTCQLSGGDDYEILATVPKNNQQDFEAAAKKCDIPVTLIGEVVNGASMLTWHDDSQRSLDQYRGFDHFANNTE